MKKTTPYLLILSILLTFLLIPLDVSWGLDISNQIITPYVLKTGDVQELNNITDYTFDSDGEQLIPLKISQNGCLEMTLTAKDAGYINMELHQKKDGADLPTSIGFPCTVDRNNQYTVYQYMNAGVYYLRFPKNQYRINLRMYSSTTRNIKNGTVIAAYCDNDVIDTFNYKAGQTGYVTLSQKRLIETAAPMSVSFYNEKNKKITDVVSDHEIATKIVFPVIKGKTYKIKVKTLSVDGEQFYQMKLAFTSFKEKCGSRKTEAVDFKLKTYTQGIVYAEDSAKTQDWYKFTNKKTQNLKLIYSGNVTSGSINLTMYNKNGKKIETYYLMPTKGGSATYDLGSTKKGIYYIKITKSRKQTAGIYKFKIQK